MLQKEVGITTVYVTHDQEEAFTISDRIAVMERGEIAQTGTPSEIYRAPNNHFVADFVGDLNYFRGVVQATGGRLVMRTESGVEIGLASGTGALGAAITCGIRPEKVRVNPEAGEPCLPAVVKTVTFKGSHHSAEIRLLSDEIIVANLPESSFLSEGEKVRVGWRAEDMHIFND